MKRLLPLALIGLTACASYETGDAATTIGAGIKSNNQTMSFRGRSIGRNRQNVHVWASYTVQLWKVPTDDQ